MATREQMASARGTIANREQDAQQATAEPAVAPVANVPWAPAGIVYLHQDELAADDRPDDSDDAPESRDGDSTTGFDDDTPSKPSLSLLRRTIPLLWAAALTIAALQHAGEVERRAALREPSSAELEMHDRAEPELKAAWRSIGTVTATAELKPVEPVAVERKAEPVMAKRQIEPVTVRDPENKPLDVEHPLVEPVTEVTHKTMASDEAESPVKAAAEQPERHDIDTNAAAVRTSEAQTMPDASRTFLPVVEQAEPAKPDGKGRIITSHAPQQKTARVAKPKRAHPARTKSIRYVELDGLSPRYFTIERPSRGSP